MNTKTLEQYRDEYKQKPLITMPIAGTIVWLCLGIMALFIPAKSMVLPVYIGTGSIFYLALFLSRFTGEKLLVKKEQRNPFDSLFLYTLGTVELSRLFCSELLRIYTRQRFCDVVIPHNKVITP